jgi:hypothetical protein
MSISIAVNTRNAQLNTYGTNFNNGTLVIYAGSVPGSADTALSGDTVLVTLPFSSAAFAAASAGSMTANAITQTNAAASGTAAFYRCFNSSSACIEQGLVATSGADLNMNTTAIVAGGPVQITSFIRTE